jgi:hypothetical protein
MKSDRLATGRLCADGSDSLVLVIAGTRPEAIKVAPVIRALRAHRRLQALVVNSGQHRAAVDAAFAEFGIRSDVDLPVLPALPNLARSCMHLRESRARLPTRTHCQSGSRAPWRRDWRSMSLRPGSAPYAGAPR